MRGLTISLAVPSTPWKPERVESLKRLEFALGVRTAPDVVERSAPLEGTYSHYRVFGEPASNWRWSEQMWTWLAETDASHVLSLQDDVFASPRFWPALRAMLTAVPDQVICLETVHPAARALAGEGHRWMTTSDLMVGVGYVLPRALLVDFLMWRAVLTPGERVGLGAYVPNDKTVIPEDTLLGLWCIATGRRIWAPIPTIIDHDTALPSSYGHEAHGHRRPVVRWDTAGIVMGLLQDADFWREPPVHVGRFWDLSPLLAEYVPGWTPEQTAAYLRDDGRQVKRKLAALERARAADADPKARLLLCTPTKGGVHPEYCASVWRLATMVDLDVENALELAGTRLDEDNVVTARAKMIAAFLATDCTHMLFVDADVSFEPAAVYGMLASGHDFVQTPYPKRGVIDWRAVAQADDPRPIEARGHRYTLRTSGPWQIDDHGCAEIHGTGLGLTLLSRACLHAMTEAYRATLTAFASMHDAEPTVMLTRLMVAEEPGGRVVELSEDLSLCERWRQMDGKVMLYVGPGSPATHHGDYAMRGAIESLGLRRGPA